ncbi:helix-turn-helix domain-containing protein, partial [Sphaerisporangium aureirubrum]|uniref:helix-turn-helix domain-containing protein n=1 Tax=Sphaerisporangium aureirubrum TaxID=1544736 RepID=UPI003627D7EA
MNDDTAPYTVGMISRRTGLSAHTIRFWSDSGLVPPSGRSAGGYRLYDAAAVARFDLVRTLRDLGVGIAAVREILAGRATPAEVAGLHARALDAEIRTLALRRAVLRAIAERGGTTEEMTLMNDLARLSAAERRQVVDGFVAEIFAGIGPGDDAMIVAEWMREMPAEMPADPAPEQVDAWVELSGLVAGQDFRRWLRAIVLSGAADPG